MSNVSRNNKLINKAVEEWSREAFQVLITALPSIKKGGAVFNAFIESLITSKVEVLLVDFIANVNNCQTIKEKEDFINSKLAEIKRVRYHLAELDGPTGPENDPDLPYALRAYNYAINKLSNIEIFKNLNTSLEFKSYRIIEEVTDGIASRLAELKCYEQQEEHLKVNSKQKYSSLSDILSPGKNLQDIKALLIAVKVIDSKGKKICTNEFVAGVVSGLIREKFIDTSHAQALSLICDFIKIKRIIRPRTYGVSYDSGSASVTDYTLSDH